MKKWEYKAIDMRTVVLLTKELNDLGEQGWELVNLAIGKGGHYHYIFKRELLESGIGGLPIG